jgi:cytoskeleton protein RodZ
MTDTGPISIGETLKNRRLQKGLTFETINVALRIQPRFLKALEEEQWSELPANVFLEGFLVKYAEYLGLDAVGLRTQLRVQLGQAGGGEPAFTHPSPVRESIDSESMVPLRLFLFGLALLALIGGGFLFFRRQEPAGANPAKPLNQVTETEPVFTSTQTVVGIPLVEVSSTAPKTGNSVVVRAKEPVWVRVRLDDAVRFEGTLGGGEVRTWPFARVLRLRVGNVSRIAVTINGKAMPEPTSATAGDVFWPPRVGTEPTFQIPVGVKPLPPPAPVLSPVHTSTVTVSETP